MEKPDTISPEDSLQWVIRALNFILKKPAYQAKIILGDLRQELRKGPMLHIDHSNMLTIDQILRDYRMIEEEAIHIKSIWNHAWLDYSAIEAKYDSLHIDGRYKYNGIEERAILNGHIDAKVVEKFRNHPEALQLIHTGWQSPQERYTSDLMKSFLERWVYKNCMKEDGIEDPKEAATYISAYLNMKIKKHDSHIQAMRAVNLYHMEFEDFKKVCDALSLYTVSEKSEAYCKARLDTSYLNWIWAIENLDSQPITSPAHLSEYSDFLKSKVPLHKVIEAIDALQHKDTGNPRQSAIHISWWIQEYASEIPKESILQCLQEDYPVLAISAMDIAEKSHWLNVQVCQDLLQKPRIQKSPIVYERVQSRYEQCLKELCEESSQICMENCI